MPRFFVTPRQIDGDTITITGQDVNHISHVLRMAPGDNLTVSDGSGMDYYCSITSFERDAVFLSVIDRWASYVELPAKITLFQGLPKGEKMELIIQKAVELGAARIVPVEMARTIVRLDEKKREKRIKRWQSISESAAKQAGRALIPEVSDLVSFSAALDMCREMDAALMPYEKAAGMADARQLIKSLHDKKTIGILIGPEGGFDPAEAEAAEAAGVKTMTLGHRILRTETAGMTILSIMMFELEEDQND